jgi:predicted TIM-barrel fold metal-dependent hydrolase
MDFELFDADNHYYEAEDAFLRHADEKVKKHVRWVSEGKRRYLLFGDRLPSAIQNATFTPVVKPGSLHLLLKELEAGGRPNDQSFGTRPEGGSMTEMGGTRNRELVPISPEYRDRDARLMVMDQQGVERNFLFPTLGQSCETMVSDDPDMLYRCFRAFNDWVDDDWGFNHKDRIYAPPVVPMMEIGGAVRELQRVIDMGTKAVVLRSGPVYGRSPADPYFDPFWSLINDSGTLVLFHAIAGPTPYPAGFHAMWNRPADDRQHMSDLEATIFPFERPAMDSLSAMILGNSFGRFPDMKVAVIEMGGAWVEYLMHSLDHAGGVFKRQVTAFGTPLADKPSEIFKRHVWVSPFPEEDVRALANVLGTDHVLMGSDWPHGEGVPQPADYRECLVGFSDAEVRMIMRENALSLIS